MANFNPINRYNQPPANPYAKPAVRRVMADYAANGLFTRKRTVKGRLLSLLTFKNAVIVIVSFMVLTTGFNIVSSATVNTFQSCTVTSKDRTADYKGNSDMRVYANCAGNPDVQVFTANDNPFTLQFNSADIFGNIQVGKTYDFTAHGFRVPLFSMFPNISAVTATR